MITRALPDADTIAFSPPFVVTEAEIDEMVDVTRKALDDVAAELPRRMTGTARWQRSWADREPDRRDGRAGRPARHGRPGRLAEARRRGAVR